MELLLQRYFALIAKIISPPGRKSVEKIGLLDAVPSCSINNFKRKKKRSEILGKLLHMKEMLTVYLL